MICGKINIGLDEGIDGSDVFPVAVKEVPAYIHVADGLGDEILSEIRLVVVQEFDQGFSAEKVDSHGSEVFLFGVDFREVFFDQIDVGVAGSGFGGFRFFDEVVTL